MKVLNVIDVHTKEVVATYRYSDLHLRTLLGHMFLEHGVSSDGGEELAFNVTARLHLGEYGIPIIKQALTPYAMAVLLIEGWAVETPWGEVLTSNTVIEDIGEPVIYFDEEDD